MQVYIVLLLIVVGELESIVVPIFRFLYCYNFVLACSVLNSKLQKRTATSAIVLVVKHSFATSNTLGLGARLVLGSCTITVIIN